MRGGGLAGFLAATCARGLRFFQVPTTLLAQDKKDQALVELKKARALVSKSHMAMAPKASPKLVNVRCPIMGAALQADKVSANLTRMFKGRKVGFCCAGCLVAWDKLSDAVKVKKLHAATPKPKNVDVHDGHGH